MRKRPCWTPPRRLMDPRSGGRLRLPQSCHKPDGGRHGGAKSPGLPVECRETGRPGAIMVVFHRFCWLRREHHTSWPVGLRLGCKDQRNQGSETMDPVAEFRRHADECRRMARGTANLEDKASWNQMAERWLACANQFETRAKAMQTAAGRRGTGGSQHAA